MKIRDRITYTLSITAFIAVAILGLLLYYFIARFHQRQFFTRLEERVALTELMFLEQNEEIKQTVRNKFLQTLDEEKEYAISLKPDGIDSLERLFPPGVAQKIQRQEIVRFWQGELQGLGRHYSLPNGEYAVVVTALDTFGQTKLDFLKRILLIGGIILIGALVAVYRFGIAKALRPLENKILRASKISADRLDLRLNVKNPSDEIGKVAIAFNRMLDRLQHSFEAQRQFVRNASHEMRTPLTAIRGEIEVLLAKDRSSEEYQETLGIIQQETDRLQVLIKQLLELEKTDALVDIPDPKVFSLDACLLETIEQFPPNRLQLNLDPDADDNLVFGSEQLLGIAIRNLIDNALKYSEGEPISVSFLRENSRCVIEIEDKGIGIPAEELQNIFHPFYRSGNARGKHGHGIGLALVKKIISLHNGRIRLLSKEGEGTKAIIHLPAVDT